MSRVRPVDFIRKEPLPGKDDSKDETDKDMSDVDPEELAKQSAQAYRDWDQRKLAQEDVDQVPVPLVTKDDQTNNHKSLVRAVLASRRCQLLLSMCGLMGCRGLIVVSWSWSEYCESAQHRKLWHSLYLIVKRNRAEHAWQFPQGGFKRSESVREVCTRVVVVVAGSIVRPCCAKKTV